MNDHHEHGGHEHDHGGSARALTLISLAHGINHAQSALKPLVYPLVLLQLGFGYAELGIMLGVASAVGGSLQLVAGGLGQICEASSTLGTRQRVCWHLLYPHRRRPKFSPILLMDGHVAGRWRGPAPRGQRPSVAPFSAQTFGNGLGSALYRGKRRHRAHPPVRRHSHQPLGLAHHDDSIRAAGDHRGCRDVHFLKGSASEE